MASRLQIAKPFIAAFFNEGSKKVFKRRDLSNILEENRSKWHIPESVYTRKFLEFLVEENIIREVELRAELYEVEEHRYLSGNPSPYAVALSLRKNLYLSHGSAVFIHNLNDQIPKTIFVNYEQSPKPSGSGLTQEGIDKAFSHTQRQSKFSFDFDDYHILLLNGKATGRLEVSQINGPNGELLDVTKLERTLIDIAVRPAYAGGVFQVLEAYKGAKESASLNTLIATLKKLNYVYPYHQAIGFYMERAGYPESKWSKLLKMGTKFDFYLTHQIPEDGRKYDSKWRLYYPSGF